MTEYKKITQKEIFVIFKLYDGGKIEPIDAYWEENIAIQAMANDFLVGPLTYKTVIFKVNLHGHMLDYK